MNRRMTIQLEPGSHEINPLHVSSATWEKVERGGSRLDCWTSLLFSYDCNALFNFLAKIYTFALPIFLTGPPEFAKCWSVREPVIYVLAEYVR